MARDATHPARSPVGIGLPDAAWLFLIAGIAVIGSVVLIPAAESLDDARYRRDVALTWERERIDRLERHEAYLQSIRDREAATIAQLRAIQLNRYPGGLEPLTELDVDLRLASASVFSMLEPEPRVPPPPPKHTMERSRLARWATGERTRLWLIAGGGLCVLLGLMPTAAAAPTRRAGATKPHESTDDDPEAEPEYEDELDEDEAEDWDDAEGEEDQYDVDEYDEDGYDEEEAEEEEAEDDATVYA